MAQITQDLVQSSVVSSTGVTDFGNTVASDDSRASFDCSSGTNVIFELIYSIYIALRSVMLFLGVRIGSRAPSFPVNTLK